MHVLGIDAGGTKTVALLADAEGRVVADGRAGGANLQTDGELQVEKILHAVIEQATRGHHLAPAAVCLGMAGVDRERDGMVIRDIMRRLGFRANTLIVNDALIALVAGAGPSPGVVVISGTGSIAYGVSHRGVAARAGGWGPTLGDEGSGYWIGRRALEAIARDVDGRGPHTALTPLVLEHFSLARPEALIAEIYHRKHSRRAVASLGPVVNRARAEGDMVAGEIMIDAADELALAASSVIFRLEMRGEQFPILLAGGMLKTGSGPASARGASYGEVSPERPGGREGGNRDPVDSAREGASLAQGRPGSGPSTGSGPPRAESRGGNWLAAEIAKRMAEVAPRSEVLPLTQEPAVGAVRLALAEARGGVRVPPYIDTFRATAQ